MWRVCWSLETAEGSLLAAGLCKLNLQPWGEDLEYIEWRQLCKLRVGIYSLGEACRASLESVSGHHHQPEPCVLGCFLLLPSWMMQEIPKLTFCTFEGGAVAMVSGTLGNAGFPLQDSIPVLKRIELYVLSRRDCSKLWGRSHWLLALWDKVGSALRTQIWTWVPGLLINTWSKSVTECGDMVQEGNLVHRWGTHKMHFTFFYFTFLLTYINWTK